MRLVLVTLALALAGCHGSTPAPAAGGLVLHVAMATAPIGNDVAIASVTMHLSALRAVSDRSANDPRAAASDLDLTLGDGVDVAMPTAPPGLYSAVDTLLGSAADTGLDIQAVWNSARVHATLVSAPFDVGCAEPVQLDPGRRARLELQIDPTSWFAGMDLSSASSDPDDAGIVISADDNWSLATTLLANVTASFALACTVQ